MAKQVSKVTQKSQKKPDNINAKPESPKVIENDINTEAKVFGLISFPNWATTLFWYLLCLVKFLFFLWILERAYDIRTMAIKEYGRVIHEFDPWFNYRATEYLEKEGWTKFFTWFDHMSWYPLGRPVGTTIYPGMQITSVVIYRALNFLSKTFNVAWLGMSLNDVCVFVPAWFGAVATFFLSLLTYECSGSINASLISAAIMAIIPAHSMRSIGGGYDNESVAMTTMLMTFYFWIRSLRSEKSWPIGIIAGLAYIYMVATWGGYIFVINMVGVHAGLLLGINFLRGVYSRPLYLSYTLFFVIGTLGATTVPVVGFMPFKSLEQIGPLGVFILYQLFELSRIVSLKMGHKQGSWGDIRTKLTVFAIAFVIIGVIVSLLVPTGFFGPLSARVRGLFLKHTRTGNPLVDSVAEHQPASPDSFNHFLHHTYFATQLGLVLTVLNYSKWNQSSFLILFCVIVYLFCLKMSRLLLLAGPVASALSGVGLGLILDWALDQILVQPAERETHSNSSPKGFVNDWIVPIVKKIRDIYNHKFVYVLRLAIVISLIVLVWQHKHYVVEFKEHSYSSARSMSEPSLMFKYPNPQTGEQILIDDYLLAYHWLRDKTPKDSRVMSWWDYGYQITGIGQRTTIADGNTWNHEHIATLGYCLASPTFQAHKLIRHLADYVLVWSGGYQDDLAKSPHMARIGNSVYKDLCPKDPTCDNFGFTGRDMQGNLEPSPMMRKSLLFNLISNHRDAYVNPKYFKKVHGTKHDLVRIYKVMNVSQESKEWLADPKNRNCDHPGSWYCVGNYPPAEPIQNLLKKRTPFKQLEDFNKAEKDEEYHKEYLRKMEKHHDE